MVAQSALASWIKTQRKRLGWKSEELGSRLRAGGYEVQDTTVRTWEAGRRPSAANIAALERLFDATAPLEVTQGGADLSAVVTALNDQTQALMAALRARDDAIEQLLRELAQYRREAAESRLVERSLIEALPGALATALAEVRAADHERAAHGRAR